MSVSPGHQTRRSLSAFCGNKKIALFNIDQHKPRNTLNIPVSDRAPLRPIGAPPVRKTGGN
jgi:hypothetical protein